jgi:hypothetical protein
MSTALPVPRKCFSHVFRQEKLLSDQSATRLISPIASCSQVLDLSIPADEDIDNPVLEIHEII